MQSFIYGYIEEAWPGARYEGSAERKQLLIQNARVIEDHTEAVLLSLPEDDEWPPLSRHMFALPPANALKISYKNRLVHFAASLKEADWELRDWLDKFEENLLGRLYWEKAVVHFQGAYHEPHMFTWTPTREWVRRLTDGVLEPVVQWDFTSTMEIGELENLRYNRS